MTEISPREFGKLEAQVEALQEQVAQVSREVKTLLEMANQSKGGLWVGMSIASAIGGAITFFATKVLR